MADEGDLSISEPDVSCQEITKFEEIGTKVTNKSKPAPLAGRHSKSAYAPMDTLGTPVALGKPNSNRLKTTPREKQDEDFQEPKEPRLTLKPKTSVENLVLDRAPEMCRESKCNIFNESPARSLMYPDDDIKIQKQTPLCDVFNSIPYIYPCGCSFLKGVNHVLLSDIAISSPHQKEPEPRFSFSFSNNYSRPNHLYDRLRYIKSPFKGNTLEFFGIEMVDQAICGYLRVDNNALTYEIHKFDNSDKQCKIYSEGIFETHTRGVTHRNLGNSDEDAKNKPVVMMTYPTWKVLPDTIKDMFSGYKEWTKLDAPVKVEFTINRKFSYLPLFRTFILKFHDMTQQRTGNKPLFHKTNNPTYNVQDTNRQTAANSSALASIRFPQTSGTNAVPNTFYSHGCSLFGDIVRRSTRFMRTTYFGMDSNDGDVEITRTVTNNSAYVNPMPTFESAELLFYYPIPTSSDKTPDGVAIPIISPDSLAITEAEKARLSPGIYLNDILIDFELIRVCESLPRDILDRIHFYSSHFYNLYSETRISAYESLQQSKQAQVEKPTVISDDDSKPDVVIDEPANLEESLSPTEVAKKMAHARVASWTAGTDIFQKDYLLIPINENLHWYLLIVCFPGRLLNPSNATEEDSVDLTDTFNRSTTILVFDSLGIKRMSTVNRIKEYLVLEAANRLEKVMDMSTIDPECRPNIKHISATHVKCPLQMNSTDCGLFLIHNAEEFLRNANSVAKNVIEQKTDMSEWYSQDTIYARRKGMLEDVNRYAEQFKFLYPNLHLKKKVKPEGDVEASEGVLHESSDLEEIDASAFQASTKK